MDITAKRLVSERGHELMDQELQDCPVITLEKYEKWYDVYLVYPNGTVTPVPPQTVLRLAEKNGWWVDHVYHPTLLLQLAKYFEGTVSCVTLELAAGRWIMERVEDSGMQYFLDDESESA